MSEHDEDPQEEFDDEDSLDNSVTIEITGLSLFTHIGVSGAEREVGQRLVFDIRLELGACDATVTDRVQDTVDYGEVCDVVALVATQRSDKTLERLTTAVAERIMRDFAPDEVWVKAAKPEPPLPFQIEEVSVEVYRSRADDDDGDE